MSGEKGEGGSGEYAVWVVKSLFVDLDMWFAGRGGWRHVSDLAHRLLGEGYMVLLVPAAAEKRGRDEWLTVEDLEGLIEGGDG